MKSILIFPLLFPFSCFAGESATGTYRFVEAKSIEEKGSLPPRLFMTLEIMCNEEVAEVVRYEKMDHKTKKTTIALGALVHENLLSSCAGEKRLISVDAGNTFSGRPYEFIRIKK